MSIERKSTLVAIIVSIILAIAKVTVGILSGSVAVIASALDSVMDMFVSVFNNIALKISESSPDKRFNYGKDKIEGLAALFEGLIIIASDLCNGFFYNYGGCISCFFKLYSKKNRQFGYKIRFASL